MNLSYFKTGKEYGGKLWRLRSVYRAMKFAYKHPRHAQIMIKNATEKEWDMEANYSGINENGFLKVLICLGDEAKAMQEAETELKSFLDE